MSELTISHTQLRSLLEPVLPFVGDDHGPQKLAGVRVRTAGRLIVAEAASATRFAQCRKPTVEDLAPFDVLIPSSDVRMILSLDRQSTVSMVTATDSSLVVDVRGDVRSSSWVFDTIPPAGFPDLETKFRKHVAAATANGGRRARLNSDQLFVLSDAVRPAVNPENDPLVIYPGTTVAEPVLVTAGAHFIAVLSPPSPLAERHTKWRKPRTVTVDPLGLWLTQLDPPQ